MGHIFFHTGSYCVCQSNRSEYIDTHCSALQRVCVCVCMVPLYRWAVEHSLYLMSYVYDVSPLEKISSWEGLASVVLMLHLWKHWKSIQYMAFSFLSSPFYIRIYKHNLYLVIPIDSEEYMYIT